jgi:hypothetical protein
MNTYLDKIASAITRFVDNPVTNLVKGIALLFIGLSEASRTFADDLEHKQLRVGHGLVIIGFFGILSALPHLIDGLQVSRIYLEHRKAKGRTDSETGVEPEKGGERS